MPAIFGERAFQRALGEARQRGYRIEYAIALGDARRVYGDTLEQISFN